MVNSKFVFGALILSFVSILQIYGQEIAGAGSLKGPAAALYKQAQTDGRKFADAAKMKPEIIPTSDGRSYFVAWSASAKPKKWIVTLHGAGMPARGYATDDFAIWSQNLTGRDVGIFSLQWWLGKGDGPEAFYTPVEIYKEIDSLLQKKKIAPGTVMLQGFSRGSANTYAVAAIDAGQGKKYFSLIVANSGGMSANYPPNKSILSGEYGKKPLAGTNWITVAGALDHNPDRDGINGMRLTGAWLREQGAVVVKAIEDPKFGHGALNLNPANSREVLDFFLK